MCYILLVEDNQSNADMVIRILQAHNYQIKHYLRGFDGMKAAREARPALGSAMVALPKKFSSSAVRCYPLIRIHCP